MRLLFFFFTVEPPIMDTPNKPLYKGYTLRSLLYYVYILVHFNLQKEYNLSITDKMLGPNVSIILRFHCIP